MVKSRQRLCSQFEFNNYKKVFFVTEKEFISFVKKVRDANLNKIKDFTIVYRDSHLANKLLDLLRLKGAPNLTIRMQYVSDLSSSTGLHFFKDSRVIFCTDVINSFNHESFNTVSTIYDQVNSKVIFVTLLEEEMKEDYQLLSSYYFAEKIPDTTALLYKENWYQYIHIGTN